MITDTLETELKTYAAHRDAWLAQGLVGRFAVIKGERIVSIEPTHEQAVREGIRLTRSRVFLIQRIEPRDAVEWLSHAE